MFNQKSEKKNLKKRNLSLKKYNKLAYCNVHLRNTYLIFSVNICFQYKSKHYISWVHLSIKLSTKQILRYIYIEKEVKRFLKIEGTQTKLYEEERIVFIYIIF